jgi:putative transcriptional regulator
MDVEKIAKAIEADAGEPLPDLRQALTEAQSRTGRVTTPGGVLCLMRLIVRHPELTAELAA